MNIELLVDSAEFWARLQDDLAAARGHVYLQTFSFEGDSVGAALGEALESCQAPDRRLLVDSYSLLYHNDRLIPGPAWAGSDFRAEVRSTHAWVRRMRGSGIGMRFGNPLGLHPVRLLKRNHKKLAIVDGRVSYLGGINFCEHNFAWHDAMLRVESSELAEHLAGDFRASWLGTPLASDQTVGPLRVLSLNGLGNAEGFLPLLDAVDSARHGIDVVSAYLSPPFSDHLARAAKRGVRVRILTPQHNNKAHLAAFILEAARRHGFALASYPDRMNHMKAMVIDGETLVFGSSNFDCVSYSLLDELFVITHDSEVIRLFLERIWDPDSSGARPARATHSLGTSLAHRVVRAAAHLLSALAPTGQET